MSDEVYEMPLSEAIRVYTLPELVRVFGKTHPAFLAALVRASTQLQLE